MKLFETIEIIAEGTTLNGKWKIESSIGSGSYGTVYGASDISSNISVAVKVEHKSPISLIKNEYDTYQRLQSDSKQAPIVGIPRIHHFGTTLFHTYLVMEKLGTSFEELICGGKFKHFSAPTVLSIGLQILDRLESIHCKGVLHLDVKPANLLIGGTDSTSGTVFLVDFGTARVHVDPLTNVREGCEQRVPFSGSIGYASQHRHKHSLPCYRDDLESLLYTLYFLRNGKLPWETVRTTRLVEMVSIVGDAKKNLSADELSTRFPSPMVQAVSYIRALRVNEKPRYNYIGQLFRTCLQNIGVEGVARMDWAQ